MNTELRTKRPLEVLREAQGWSRAEFGRRARISRQAIEQIEKGLIRPSLPIALRLSRILNTTVEDLFGHMEVAE